MNLQSRSRCSLLIAWLFIILASYIYPQPYEVLSIQGDGINVRQEADVNSKVVLKLNTTDRCDVVAVGNKETVSGKEDYWYQVKYQSKIGWVFGAFTSLRQEGKETITATFKDCFYGDIGHLIFIDTKGKEWDFGQGPNNLGDYKFCIDPEELGEAEPNPVYIGKKFSVTYTINKCSSYLEGEGLVDCPTIVELKEAAVEFTSDNTSCNNKNDYFPDLRWDKLTFIQLRDQGTYKILKEFINEDFVIGSNYEYAYVSDLNNDGGKEYFFCQFVPQHGGCEGVLISKINNEWFKIFEFTGEPDYFWGIMPLKSRTNGYYDICLEGIKYKFTGREYLKE